MHFQNSQDVTVWATLLLLTIVSFWRDELSLQYLLAVLAIMFAISALAWLILKEPNWWLPLCVLNSRGASRLMLWKWRGAAYYGWWLMALTCLLTTVLFPHWLTPLLALSMQLACLAWLIKRWPGDEQPRPGPLGNWVVLGVWMLLSHRWRL